MRFCQLIGAEPYLCVNMGTGTMDEAAAWVEYCNGTSDTYWANQRRANGHEDPYGVKMSVMPWDVFYQKLLPAFAAGTGPDIAAMDTQQLPQYATKNVVPLTSGTTCCGR